MVQKYNIILDTPDIWAIVSFRSIHEIGVSELPNKGRDFGAHAMLFPKCLVGIALQGQSFEQTSIEIIAVPLFNRKQIIVHLWAELPVDGNEGVGMQFEKRGL